MVKDKEIRPTRARSLGEILPRTSVILQYTEAEYEDFHTVRTNGATVQYKDFTSNTVNLNSNWTETSLSITQITGMRVHNQGSIVVHLYKAENNEALAGEEVTVTVGNHVMTGTTNSNGFASINFTPPEPGTYTAKAEYNGNLSRSLKRATDVTETFTVGKLNVTINATNVSMYAGDTYQYDVTISDENGDNVASGNLNLQAGASVIFSKQLTSTGTFYNLQFSTAGQKNFTLVYSGTTVYNSSSKNIVVTVQRSNVAVSASNTSTPWGEQVSIPVSVTKQGVAVTSGTLQVYEGGTLIDTVSVSGATTNVAYTPSTVGTHTLTVKYVQNDQYNEATTTVNVTATKHTTTTLITVGDILDYPGSSPSFTVQVKDGNTPVTEGTLTLSFEQASISEEEDVATFDLSQTGGTITLNRGNLSLDTLYDTIKGRRYLYYTGYTVHASYAGSSKYSASSDTKQPVNISAKGSVIKPIVDVRNSSQDSTFMNDYSTVAVDNTSLATLSIRVNHETQTATLVQMNRTYPLDEIDSGTVNVGQVIYFAQRFLATHTTDSQRNFTSSQLSSIGSEGVGGLHYDVHYQINNGAEVDTAEAFLNTGTTYYTVPTYSKLTVPNTCHSGDTLRVIFYIGRNVGYYYDMANGSSDYGLRYVFKFTVG